LLRIPTINRLPILNAIVNGIKVDRIKTTDTCQNLEEVTVGLTRDPEARGGKANDMEGKCLDQFGRQLVERGAFSMMTKEILRVCWFKVFLKGRPKLKTTIVKSTTLQPSRPGTERSKKLNNLAVQGRGEPGNWWSCLSMTN
jgi:hypothetical protein